MKDFKSFRLQEDVRASHAAKFMNYEEKYHHKLANEARRTILSAWREVLPTLDMPNEEVVARAKELNGKALTHVTLVDHPELMSSARWMGSKYVGPAVKIPTLIAAHERKAIAKLFQRVARERLDDLIKHTTRILHLDDDDLPALFRVVADDDDVKLQFVSKKAGRETAKTIFKVAVEHGRPGSKTRDYDRVFFIDNLER